MMEVHNFNKNEHMNIPQYTQTQKHSPFPSSESQFAFLWGYYKYYNVSWLQSNPLQLLAAILYHPCCKFHCPADVCALILILPWCKPGSLVQFRVCTHICSSVAAGTSAPNGSSLFIACAVGVPSSCLLRKAVLPGSSLCCQQLLQQKQRQSTPGDQQEQYTGKLRCKVAITSNKLVMWLPVGIEMASIFCGVLESWVPPALHTEAKVTLQEVHCGDPAQYALSSSPVCLEMCNFWHTSVHLIVVTIRARGQIAVKDGHVKMHLGVIAVGIFQTASYCTSSREMQALVLYNCATISLNMDSAYKCCVTCRQLCTHKYVLFFRHNPGK